MAFESMGEITMLKTLTQRTEFFVMMSTRFCAEHWTEHKKNRSERLDKYHFALLDLHGRD
jgi:hypothetical protein